MEKIVLVTGGARSGKSSYALQCTSRYLRKGFIATASAADDEMKQRIAKHQQERGSEFITVEETRHLAQALDSLQQRVEVVVIDCLTVWLGNLFYYHDEPQQHFPEIEAFLDALKRPVCDIFIVTNEVGAGIVPENSLARCFRDQAGLLNQQVAHIADKVIFMVSGYPIFVKGDSLE